MLTSANHIARHMAGLDYWASSGVRAEVPDKGHLGLGVRDRRLGFDKRRGWDPGHWETLVSTASL